MKTVAEEINTNSVMKIIQIEKVVFKAVLLNKIKKYREINK